MTNEELRIIAAKIGDQVFEEFADIPVLIESLDISIAERDILIDAYKTTLVDDALRISELQGVISEKTIKILELQDQLDEVPEPEPVPGIVTAEPVKDAGTRKVALVRVHFQDRQCTASHDRMMETMKETRDFFATSSYGKIMIGDIDLLPDVTVPITSDRAKDYRVWRGMVKTELGISGDDYRYIYYITPQFYGGPSNVGWTNKGYYRSGGGSEPAEIYILRLSSDIMKHETGHAEGIMHSGLLENPYSNEFASGSPGTYGDTSCVQGYSGLSDLRDFNAPQKHGLGITQPILITESTEIQLRSVDSLDEVSVMFHSPMSAKFSASGYRLPEFFYYVSLRERVNLSTTINPKYLGVNIHLKQEAKYGRPSSGLATVLGDGEFHEDIDKGIRIEHLGDGLVSIVL